MMSSNPYSHTDLARRHVDLVEIVVEAADERGRACRWSLDDGGLAGPAAAGPRGRLDGVVRLVALLAHAGGQPAADGRLPDERRASSGGGPRPYSRRVSSPRKVLDLDAVALRASIGAGGSTATPRGYAPDDEDAGRRRRRSSPRRPARSVRRSPGPDGSGPTRSCAQPPATKTPAAMTTRRETTRRRRRRRWRRRRNSRPPSLI